MTTRFLLNVVFVASAAAQTYDVVLTGGRVMDPESGLDAVRDVGITGGRIAAISTTPLTGRARVDVAGAVVAPGFIDLHAHGQLPENYRLQARDGVTTALELEIGVSPVEAWYAERTGRSLINFGASAGHVGASMIVLGDTGVFLPRDAATTTRPNADQKERIEARVRLDLDNGAVGIGLGIAYLPKSSREEIFDIFRLAALYQVPCFVHVRHGGRADPHGIAEALQEVLSDALATGAPLHIVHINSSASAALPVALRMIEGARRSGLDVTTEAYPYTAGQTNIDSAIFDEGWQEKLGITYKDLQWVETGDRLTAESFARYRKQGGTVIAHSMSEETIRMAMAHPMVMIASDSFLRDGKGHPRSSGTFSRVLGRYVREEKILPLMEGIRKMTLMPAQRLERAVPQMRHKGRLRVGADADITVFDAGRIIDRATWEKPAEFSEGILHVMVNG
ncbi:MAG: amidohydrolase family protein, partial [Bryobacteraceae bacterium]